MNLSTSCRIPAARDRVFAAITDPAILQRVIDGCERMVRTGPDTYDAHLKIGVAGLKGNYVGKIELRDQQPPASFTLVLSGKGAPGFVQGTARLQFTELGAETELRCEAEAKVGGLIAAIGSRLIEAAARKMMDEFFRKFAEQIKASPPGASPAMP